MDVKNESELNWTLARRSRSAVCSYQLPIQVRSTPHDKRLRATECENVTVCCVQTMMKAKSYPDFDPHKKMHDDFVAKLGGLSAPVSTDTVHFAKDWYVSATFHVSE